jgi:hypothetical protein
VCQERCLTWYSVSGTYYTVSSIIGAMYSYRILHFFFYYCCYWFVRCINERSTFGNLKLGKILMKDCIKILISYVFLFRKITVQPNFSRIFVSRKRAVNYVASRIFSRIFASASRNAQKNTADMSIWHDRHDPQMG